MNNYISSLDPSADINTLPMFYNCFGLYLFWIHYDHQARWILYNALTDKESGSFNSVANV